MKVLDLRIFILVFVNVINNNNYLKNIIIEFIFIFYFTKYIMEKNTTLEKDNIVNFNKLDNSKDLDILLDRVDDSQLIYLFLESLKN